jgi:ribonuclease P/MRP protein subunit POP7
VKRARKLLAVVDQRSLGKVSLSKGTEKERLRQLGQKGSEREQVFLRGTGKAIEKVLGLAVYFQSQDDLEVRIKTGSVGVVDDIERKEGNRGSDHDDEEGGGIKVGEEIPETQIRKASVIEVAISLK